MPIVLTTKRAGCTVSRERVLKYCSWYEGKDRFTYYHTLRDRINGDGLRIDYIYGSFATWAEGRMVVRHDIPGDDHLPVQWQPPADFVDGKYEEDCNFKDLTPLCAMMSELNPRELDTKDVLRLGNVLKAIDESRSKGLGSDNHGHSSDDGQTVDLKIRRVYRLTVRSSRIACMVIVLRLYLDME